jgi:hypothetical protein
VKICNISAKRVLQKTQIFNDYVVNSGLHLGLRDLKDLMTECLCHDASGHHSDFSIGPRYSRIRLSLMRTSQVYILPQFRKHNHLHPNQRFFSSVLIRLSRTLMLQNFLLSKFGHLFTRKFPTQL